MGHLSFFSPQSVTLQPPACLTGMMTDSEFEILARELRPQLVASARAVVHDSATAEDVAQDALLKLWTMPQRERARQNHGSPHGTQYNTRQHPRLHRGNIGGRRRHSFARGRVSPPRTRSLHRLSAGIAAAGTADSNTPAPHRRLRQCPHSLSAGHIGRRRAHRGEPCQAPGGRSLRHCAGIKNQPRLLTSP